MNRYRSLFFIIPVFLLCISGCENEKETTENVVIGKTIIPEGSQDEDRRPRFVGNSNTEDYYRQESIPKVDNYPREIILQVMDVNLDFDRIDEQILVIKEKESTRSPIEIVVIDFDNVKNSYETSWRQETVATNIRNFTIALEDIVGDHNLEIICFGNDDANNRTLDVFRKTHAPTGVGLFYKSICSIRSNGTIEIAKQNRSQAYKQGQKNGISFPIISYSQDHESDNILDLIKREYYWKYQDQKYVLGKEEKIPGKKIEEKKLETLFRGPVAAYEEYLDGLWHKTDNQDANEAKKNIQIISFDKDKKKISFFENDVQEVYFWRSTHKTRIPNSFYINGQNESVPFIEKQISVQVQSLDTIRIFVQDSDFKKSSFNWDGTYSQLPEEATPSLIKTASSEKHLLGSELYGTFTGDEQRQITFDFPYFTLREGKKSSNGGYSIYSIDGTNILELKFFNQNGLVERTRRYKISYEKEVNEDTVLHHCILVPGKVTVKGFSPEEDTEIRFEQVEIIEEEEQQAKEPDKSEA